MSLATPESLARPSCGGWRGARAVALILLIALAGLPLVALAATEGGGHGEGGGLINIDASFFVQLVNFLILLAVLIWILYKPLLAKMEERTAAIQKSLDEAQLARAEAQRQQEENAARLRAAYAEAQAIREAALKEAGEEQRKLVEAARVEAQRLVETARAQMETDVRRAREDLRREVADLATSVAERLVRRSLRDEDHRRIVDDALAAMAKSQS
jgi:F-type H+-transporting ATPase subunit b